MPRPSAGLPFEPLDRVARDACALDDARLIEAVGAGLLPLRTPDGPTLVVAPRAMAARRTWQLVAQSDELPRRLSLTSSDRLRDFVIRHSAEALGRKAADDHRTRRPEMSAAAIHPVTAVAALMAMLAVVAALVAAATMVSALFGASLVAVFLAWTGLRALGALSTPPAEPARRLPADQLPIYTIIIGLYREAAAAGGLIAALDMLDYPPEKARRENRARSRRRRNPCGDRGDGASPPYEIIIAPDIGPRTKPKARGSFTVVYDAEDRPEPEQAVAAFLAGSDRLACVQARLCIDNTEDSWLTRMFTAEYAGLFDVFLPGLSSYHLPLGGSSNHFPTAALRAIGGWDPYNLTEDADLGMRLARFGYNCAQTIKSRLNNKVSPKQQSRYEKW